jgi:ferredoxin
MADRILSLGKYVVLAVVLVATWRTGELVFRGFDPCYALIGRHGADITWWAYAVSALVAVASLFISLPFCRWLCPLAAVLNPLSRFGLTRIKRDKEACTDCEVCSKRCPVAIPVHQVEQVTAARCISCLSCVESCPGNRPETRSLVWGPPGRARHGWPRAALVVILLLCTTAAVAASYLFPIPSFSRSRGIRPDRVAIVELRIEDLTCRGRANLLFYFLDRDDMFRIPGYFKVEAWPGPNAADVRVTYEANVANEDTIKRAITEPYFDTAANFWRSSPFRIEGYDPLEIDIDVFDEPLPP